MQGQNNELAHRFAYHPPKDDRARQSHENIRGQVGRLAEFIVATTPAGREQALAVTKLEEAMMWANAAIARHGAVTAADQEAIK